MEKGRLHKNIVFEEIEDVVNITIINGKRRRSLNGSRV